MKKQILAVLTLLFLVSIIAAIGCENSIREYFPRFDGNLYASGSIFLFGFTYAMVVRNFIIFFISMAAAIATPWVAEWFHSHWPYIIHIMTN